MKKGKISGIGIDIVDVARFKVLLTKNKRHQLAKLFTSLEQEYCLSYKDAAMHFAGTFAAKEAAYKARGDRSLVLESIEIRRAKSGAPQVWIKGYLVATLLVSISHTDDIACAVVYNQGS